MMILLKNTIRTMSPIIEDAEDDWIVHNIFMQYKNMIDKQIVFFRYKVKYHILGQLPMHLRYLLTVHKRFSSVS
jgi:hypothetical protein